MIVAIILGLSAVLGVFRESSVAYMFGATKATDAYLIAMTIPNLFIGVINGSITKTYITVYGGYLAQERTEDAWRTTNILLSSMLILLLALLMLSLVFSGLFVHLLAPSFSGERLKLTVELTRIVLPSILFVPIIGILTGINNTHNSFITPAMNGLVSNIITILCIFSLGSVWGIYGLALGSLLAILAQFILQIPSAYKHGFRFHYVLDWHDPGIREMLILVTPFILSAATSQLNIIVGPILATGLTEGTISALYFANKLVFLPQVIFTGAIGTVVFPMLVRAAAKDDWTKMLEGISQALRLLLLILLPSVVGLYVLRHSLVKLMFEHGEFTTAQTQLTADTIPYLLPALVFSGIVSMLVYIYVATKSMAVPVFTGLISVVVNIGFSLWLIVPLMQKGLALASSISAIVNALLLAFFLIRILNLHKKTWLSMSDLLRFAMRVWIASVIMGIAVWGLGELLGPFTNGVRGNAVLVISSILLGLVVYIYTAYVLHIEELYNKIRSLRTRLQ